VCFVVVLELDYGFRVFWKASTMVITLRVVSPLILSDEERKKELNEDLLWMGCGRLLA